MMAYFTLSDVFFSVCDSYMDVATCKPCDASIFETSTFRSPGCMDFDAREDTVSRGVALADDCDDDVRSEGNDAPLLSSVLLPHIPIGYGNHPEFREGMSVQRHPDIFRLNTRGVTGDVGDSSKFCTISRCSAWSQEYGNSNRATTQPPKESNSPIKLIHWEDIVSDASLLNKRFRSSMHRRP